MLKDSYSPGDKTFAKGCEDCAFEWRELLMHKLPGFFRIRCIFLVFQCKQWRKNCISLIVPSLIFRNNNVNPQKSEQRGPRTVQFG